MDAHRASGIKEVSKYGGGGGGGNSAKPSDNLLTLIFPTILSD
jgi:hypothetical protein